MRRKKQPNQALRRSNKRRNTQIAGSAKRIRRFFVVAVLAAASTESGKAGAWHKRLYNLSSPAAAAEDSSQDSANELSANLATGRAHRALGH